MTETQQALPLIEHLRELKRRLMWVVGALIAATVLCYAFAEPVYQFLLDPLQRQMTGEHKRLIFTNLTEPFFTYLKLAFFAGFILSFPVLAYQLYAFVAPGLYRHERNALKPFLFGAPALFLLGAAMAYYVIFPLAWAFFLGFEMPGGEGAVAIQLEAKVGEYLSLTMQLIIAFGLAFQMPVVLLLLVKSGLISRASLKEKRKYAVIGMFTLAAVMTPPDVISQVGLAVPLLLLYELTIYMAGWMETPEMDGEVE